MSEVVLDTSAWIALFRAEPAASRIVSEMGESKVVTTPLVLAELATHEAMGRTALGDPVRAVEERARVEGLTRDDAVAAAAIYARIRGRPRSKVGLADALIYATAQRIGATLVTLESDLEGERGVLVVSNAKR